MHDPEREREIFESRGGDILVRGQGREGVITGRYLRNNRQL